MDIETLDKNITNHLIEHLQQETAISTIKDVYNYALFPPGKLFRSKLSWGLAHDLSSEVDQSLNSSHAFFASFLECHHSYTLIHDDLPCMDDDSWRRGKPATHKAWGEWQALLAGDGLHGTSYRLLSRINTSRLQKLFQLVTWALGPKGLIQGQALDLGTKERKFHTLLRTHELKTGRLIQLSLIGSFLLIEKFKQPQSKYRTNLDLAKLGSHIGIVFQLLDDLSEFSQNKILTSHEKSINSWIDFDRQSLSHLQSKIENIINILHKYQLKTVSRIISGYYKNALMLLRDNKDNIEKNLKRYQIEMDLTPIMLLLKRISYGN
ncbi:MAG: polyprenyl synthetase family protein [Halobacteriovoraceae bacterium]|nr:polyprenyl synthetase family protein [Halobacteriovoraceae bacterium]